MMVVMLEDLTQGLVRSSPNIGINLLRWASKQMRDDRNIWVGRMVYMSLILRQTIFLVALDKETWQ